MRSQRRQKRLVVDRHGAVRIDLEQEAVDGAIGAGLVPVGEGLEQGDALHPLQTAFSEHHGLQCGYCTPGILMASKNLLDANPDPSRDEIKKAIAGNVCRCTGYQNIYKAVDAAAKEMRGS